MFADSAHISILGYLWSQPTKVTEPMRYLTPTIEISAALLGAQFLLENRSPIRYGFRAGETTQRIRHRVKVTSLTLILIYDYSIYRPKFLVR